MSNQGTRGPVVVNRDQMLTPGARDYLREHRVEVVYPQGEAAGGGGPSAPAKYRTLFGAALNEKPEHMTHLKGFSRCDKKWRGLLLSASIFPMMTNSVIRSFAWINILGSNGIINKVLVGLGVVPKPLKLLYTDFSIIIGSVYLFLPLMIVTVAGVMENIDDDMMEAALSLGAARMEAFMKVIFPMSLPGIIVGGILVFTGTLTAYTTPQLLGGNSNMVMATLIYQRAMSVSDWTGASVIALIMIVVTLAVIRGFNALAAKLDRRGENYA